MILIRRHARGDHGRSSLSTVVIVFRSVVFPVCEIDQLRQDYHPPRRLSFRREQSKSKLEGDVVEPFLLRGKRMQDLPSVICLLLRGELGQPSNKGRGWMKGR